MTARLTGAGTAVPAARTQEDLWEGFFGPHVDWDRWARRVFLGAGPQRRGLAVDPTKEDVSGWSTGERMARYVEEALPLARAACDDAVAAAGIDRADIGLLTVVTCTGYATPGVDIRLAAELGLDATVQRLLVGHMGCYAALPGLAATRDHVEARGRAALLVCVEVTSLHSQPASRDMEQVVAHALFADAAAAVVVEPSGPGGGGLEVLDVVAVTDPGTADHMSWDVTDLGFRMGLSRRVPDVLGRHVEALVTDLLRRSGLARADVAGWAVHPGGTRILDVVADRLGLRDGDLAASHAVLAEHGNCSSPTVLMVVDRVAPDLPAGGHLVALAFGPGLTLYGALLRRTGPA